MAAAPQNAPWAAGLGGGLAGGSQQAGGGPMDHQHQGSMVEMSAYPSPGAPGGGGGGVSAGPGAPVAFGAGYGVPPGGSSSPGGGGAAPQSPQSPAKPVPIDVDSVSAQDKQKFREYLRMAPDVLYINDAMKYCSSIARDKVDRILVVRPRFVLLVNPKQKNIVRKFHVTQVRELYVQKGKLADIVGFKVGSGPGGEQEPDLKLAVKKTADVDKLAKIVEKCGAAMNHTIPVHALPRNRRTLAQDNIDIVMPKKSLAKPRSWVPTSKFFEAREKAAPHKGTPVAPRPLAEQQQAVVLASQAASPVSDGGPQQPPFFEDAAAAAQQQQQRPDTPVAAERGQQQQDEEEQALLPPVQMSPPISPPPMPTEEEEAEAEAAAAAAVAGAAAAADERAAAAAAEEEAAAAAAAAAAAEESRPILREYSVHSAQGLEDDAPEQQWQQQLLEKQQQQQQEQQQRRLTKPAPQPLQQPHVAYPPQPLQQQYSHPYQQPQAAYPPQPLSPMGSARIVGHQAPYGWNAVPQRCSMTMNDLEGAVDPLQHYSPPMSPVSVPSQYFPVHASQGGFAQHQQLPQAYSPPESPTERNYGYFADARNTDVRQEDMLVKTLSDQYEADIRDLETRNQGLRMDLVQEKELRHKGELGLRDQIGVLMERLSQQQRVIEMYEQRDALRARITTAHGFAQPQAQAQAQAPQMALPPATTTPPTSSHHSAASGTNVAAAAAAAASPPPPPAAAPQAAYAASATSPTAHTPSRRAASARLLELI